jgi:hypothetical protein
VRSEWRTLNAVVELRRTAADVVTLCDVIVFAETETEKVAALRMLPTRIRRLQFRAGRALTALETEG